MTKTTTTTETETRWVITKDGIRMTYAEYIEMIKSERD